MLVIEGIKNFLMFINEHWTEIIVICGLAIAAYRKIKNYIKISNDEKVEIAMNLIRESMLKYVTKAESDYLTWKEAGAIKRAEVINQIYADFPILHVVIDQENLIAELDNMIKDALVIMREIFTKNTDIKE